LEKGWIEGRNPGPDFDGVWYTKHHSDIGELGINPLLHYLDFGMAEGREICAVKDAEQSRKGKREIPTVIDCLEARFPSLRPLPNFLLPDTTQRLNILTDSISAGSRCGGVGTSLILSALLAQRIGSKLRLITRLQPPDTSNFGEVLAINGIDWNRDIEFVYSPVDGSREVPLSQNELFLTTSWWTTRSIRDIIRPSRIFYLLQEDERMFYPFGDDRLRCEETMSDSGIDFIVNSELLFEHLTTGPEALASIAERGTWFEPAFPATHYYPDRSDRASNGKRNFFFYARPQNIRNLYWRGLEAITAAIQDGILKPDDWNFYFVGRELEPVALPDEVEPIICENLPWPEYASLVRRMDLGLCLMDTPHSSYPPLDLAACGAVVVTSKRGLKHSLSRYSENIFCADPTVHALTAELRKASELAADEKTRFANSARNRMLRDWRTALQPVVHHVAALIRERER
jgi:hypothetical protein